jgi:pre-rRNA-processing protein TSR3
MTCRPRVRKTEGGYREYLRQKALQSKEFTNPKPTKVNKASKVDSGDDEAAYSGEEDSLNRDESIFNPTRAGGDKEPSIRQSPEVSQGLHGILLFN